jgi:hypothetical protein
MGARRTLERYQNKRVLGLRHYSGSFEGGNDGWFVKETRWDRWQWHNFQTRNASHDERKRKLALN